MRPGLPDARVIPGRGCPLAAETTSLPTQLGLGSHSCRRCQDHKKTKLLSYRGRFEGLLPLLVQPSKFNRPGSTVQVQPSRSRVHSIRWASLVNSKGILFRRRQINRLWITSMLSVMACWGDRNVLWYTSDCWSGTRNRSARVGIPELRPFRFCPSPQFALWLKSSPNKEAPEMQR